jgi:GntP family gluconate:H+ symporter
MGVSDTKEQIRVWTGTTGVAWAVGLVELLILAVIFH